MLDANRVAWREIDCRTLGAASGAVAGLVAITPCAGFVNGMAPIYIGAITGVVCFFAISLKHKFGFDDSLDVIGVHLVGGILGSLLLGFFADQTFIQRAAGVGADGLFFGGGAKLLVNQLLAVGSTLLFSGVVTLIIIKVLAVVLPKGIRITEEEEETGLDLSQHSEVAYALQTQ